VSDQECALYGDLVLYLRDRAAELLAQSNPETSVEAERMRLDDVIRAWFFAPQDDLHGLAPRDVIWTEQKGEPNRVSDDQLDDLFFDDCPTCQAMRQDAQAELDKGHDHGWNWCYDDGGYPLIAQYDPEGWDARWAHEDQAGQDDISPTSDAEVGEEESDWAGEGEWSPDDSAYGRLPTDPDAGEPLGEDEFYGDYRVDEPFADDPRLVEDPRDAAPTLGIPATPVQAAQDAIIDRLNVVLDRDDWDGAAEMAYEALAIDPTYDRAINALLRCYLHRDTLREIHHVLLKLFDPEDDRPHQKHRVLAYSYRVMSHARLWDEWDPFEIPSELAEVQEALKEGLSALNAAYCVGEAGAYDKARAAFAQAQTRCPDAHRDAFLWWLARLYAHYGFFEESAAMLAALRASGPGNADVQRLWAEVTWWRDNGKWLPWIH
jgi:tetratricopeptide (TPR) repeat protein